MLAQQSGRAKNNASAWMCCRRLEERKMCGIGLLFVEPCNHIDGTCGTKSILEWKQHNLRQCLHRRGPDFQDEVLVQGAGSHSLWMIGSVLHIQGDQLCPQPIRDDMGNILLWNGEVFGGNVDVPKGCSDTMVVSKLLQDSCRIDDSEEASDIGSRIVGILSRIHGPFAFIFYHARSDTIFFGRDSIGRRSLVLGADLDTSPKMVKYISSVKPHICNTEYEENLTAEEVQIGGIYMIASTGDMGSVIKIPWSSGQVTLKRELRLNQILPFSEQVHFEESVHKFSEILHCAVRRRLERIGFNLKPENTVSPSENFDVCPSSFSSISSRVGVLFSGGIDSLLLTVVLHRTLQDPFEPIDLFNVAFVEEDGSTSSPAPDRLGGIVGLLELKKLFPMREFRLVHVDVKPSERTLYENHIKRTIEPLDTHMDLNIGTAFWFASRGQGYLRDYSLEDMEKSYGASLIDDRPLLRLGEEDAMKSVGLDANDEESREKFYQQRQPFSSAEILPTACENSMCNRVGKAGCLRHRCKRCCDRAYREEQLAAGADVRTVCLNDCAVHKVSEKKLSNIQEKAKRKQSLKKESTTNQSAKDTIHKETETEIMKVKEEIVKIIYGGAEDVQQHCERRYADSSFQDGLRIPYLSRCKVLLVGLGADEQLAGYGRHRTCYFQKGWEGLCDELNVDLERLWTRNLGRDDRCISDNGKEGWFPYLDEDLVDYVQSTPIDIITDLSLAPGVGDKRILRTAASYLGLSRSCQLVKRAIQFGTLAAKQTSVQYYGSKRKGKGTSKI